MAPRLLTLYESYIKDSWTATFSSNNSLPWNRESGKPRREQSKFQLVQSEVWIWKWWSFELPLQRIVSMQEIDAVQELHCSGTDWSRKIDFSWQFYCILNQHETSWKQTIQAHQWESCAHRFIEVGWIIRQINWRNDSRRDPRKSPNQIYHFKSDSISHSLRVYIETLWRYKPDR